MVGDEVGVLQLLQSFFHLVDSNVVKALVTCSDNQIIVFIAVHVVASVVVIVAEVGVITAVAVAVVIAVDSAVASVMCESWKYVGVVACVIVCDGLSVVVIVSGVAVVVAVAIVAAVAVWMPRVINVPVVINCRSGRRGCR